MFYKDGSVYVGLWQYGQRHGKGQLIVNQDKVYSGTWMGGQIIFGREDLAPKGYPDRPNAEYYYEG